MFICKGSTIDYFGFNGQRSKVSLLIYYLSLFIYLLTVLLLTPVFVQ